MTYTTPLFSTSNTDGVDLSTAFTLSTSTPEYPNPPFSLGQVVLGSNDGAWVYATASTALSKGDVCTISAAFSATPTPATASLGLMVGVAMATNTTGQFSWYQTNGVSAAINVTASVAANTLLYTSATAGRLSTAATGFTRIQGIVTNTTSAGTAGTYAGIIISASVATAQ
jgi:hypothetical protein